MANMTNMATATLRSRGSAQLSCTHALCTGVVSDREGVDDRPQRPPLPRPDPAGVVVALLHGARRHERRQVAGLGGDHHGAPRAGAVAQPGEEERHGQGFGGADGRERVGRGAAEPQGQEDGRRVGCQRGPGGVDDGCGEVVWPALVVQQGLAHELPGDLEALAAGLVVAFAEQSLLQDVLVCW